MFYSIIYAREDKIPPHVVLDFMHEQVVKQIKDNTGHLPVFTKQTKECFFDNAMSDLSANETTRIDIVIPYDDKLYSFTFLAHMYEDIVKRLKAPIHNTSSELEVLVLPYYLVILPKGTCNVLVQYLEENETKVKEACSRSSDEIKQKIQEKTWVVTMKDTPES